MAGRAGSGAGAGSQTWASNAARFSSLRGKPSMSTCCFPPLRMASSSRLIVTWRSDLTHQRPLQCCIRI